MNPRPNYRIFFSLFALLLAAQPAPAGLVAYWNFNEGTGTTANDFSSNHNNGTLTAVAGGAVPTWVAGHTGLPGDYALNTSGAGDVTVPDATSLHITNTFTLAAWVYDNGSNYGHVFSAGADSTHRTWLLQTSSYGGGSDYFWSDTGNTGFKKSLGYATPTGGWHHLAVTYDGSNLRVYGDGILKNTIAQTGSLAAWGELHLGAAGNNLAAVGSQLIGNIDDLVILNNTATAAEIVQIKDGTYPDMVPPPVWTGGGGSPYNWNNSADWGGATMTAGKPLTFATSGALGMSTNNNDFLANTPFAGIVFNAGTAAFTLNGNALNLTGDVVNNSTNTQTIANNLVLDGGTRTFNAASGNLIVNNAITQVLSQTNGLTKSGSNTLTLSGASTYAGPTSVNAGTLLLNTGASLGNTAVTVSGSTSILAGNGTVSGAVSAQSSGHLAPGIASATGTLALGGGLTLNAATLDIKAGALGINDAVNVTGNLTLTGNTQVNLTQQLAGFGLGDYVILTYTGTLSGNTSQLLAPPQDVTYSYAILTVGNQIKLHVTLASVKTYYVSQSAGSDGNTGQTSGAPWKTLAKASTVTLNAGDSILLKCGDTWNEELQPKGNGTASNPVLISSYGSGNQPLIDRVDYTQDLNGIHLVDQEGYKIYGIEFAHCQTGIYATYSVGSPTRHYVWIENCYFHDSLQYGRYESYPSPKNISLGICFFSYETANNIVLSDITVKNCTFKRLASGIWTNSPDNFNYYADNIWNFGNLTVSGCLFEQGYQWQLGLRGISGGQITNCVTHDTGRNFTAWNGVAGAMMYRLKNFTFTDSEWGFVSRNGGASGDGEAFDLEGNNSNMTFTRCLFHDTDGPCFMLYKGSNASPSNVGNLFTDCVWNGKVPLSNLGKEEIFNANPGANVAQFANYRIYLSSAEARCNNETSMTFTNGLTRNLSDAATGTNLALAASAVSASSQQVGYEATKGNDGNISSIWRPTAWAGTTGSDYLEIDFASPTLVNEFRLREDPGSSISRYAIQYWDSTSSSWLGCFNGRTMGTNFIAPIVSRTTTKLRVLVTATSSGTPGIAEFEAYYVAIPPPPTTVSWAVGNGAWDINTTPNWLSGGSAINYVDGDIVLLDNSSSGSSPVTLTLNSVVAPTSVTVNGTKSYTLTGSGGIGGTGGLTMNSSGILTLSSTNTYAGGTTINAGTLSFGSAANLPAGSVILGGGTLEFTGSGSAGTYNLSASGSASYLVNVTNAAGILTVTRAGANYNGMIKGGPGTLILANNYQDSGGVEVDAGTVVLNGTSNNPTNWSTTNTISDVKTGATLKLGNTQVGLIYYGGGTFHMSGGTFDVNGQNPAADQNHSAPVIDGSGTITNSAAGTTGTALFYLGTNRTFSGSIVDGAGVGKVAITITSGGSVWTISGVNTYSGATTINSGTIQAGSTTAFSPNSAYSVASGKTLDLAGFSNSIGSLTGAGSVTLGSGTLTIGNDNTSPAAFTGVISSATGGSLIKIGSGTWTLSGGNSYSGSTTVSAGKLLVNGSLTGSGAVNVAGGATLGGTGSIAGAVNVTGVLAPGGSIIESLSSGALTLNNGATFQCQTDSSAAATVGADFHKVVGNLSLDNSPGSTVTLSLTNLAAGSFVPGTAFSLINYTGSWNGGLFQYGASLLGDGASFGFNSQNWLIDYDATSGGANFSSEQTAGKFVNISLDPFYVWAKANITDINPSADATPGGDPDHDGWNNLAEFAFNGNPLGGGDHGKVFCLTADSLGNRQLVLTVAVRAGTPAFTGSPSPAAPWDGVIYTVEGSTSLGSWSAPVSVLATPVVTGLPDLTGTGYEYRSFRLDGSSGFPGTGFLRARVTKP